MNTKIRVATDSEIRNGQSNSLRFNGVGPNFRNLARIVHRPVDRYSVRHYPLEIGTKGV